MNGGRMEDGPMEDGTIVEEAPGVWRVDLRWMGMPRQIASYLMADGGDLAVIETGPASTLPALLDALRSLGHGPEDVTHALVTHIHLDHSGGAGALLRLAPRARVHVHPAGAPHLADPSRLLASAAQLYGERMDEMWGETLPVPDDRITILEDGDEVRVGGRVLRAVETPGHAGHHHAFNDPEARLVFTGDVGGIRVAGARYVCAPTPPPEIDVALWRESVRRLRALRPSVLLPTHFGAAADPEWHLDDLERRLDWIDAGAAPLVAAGAGVAELAEAMRARAEEDILAATGSPELVRAYELAVPYPMMAAGVHRHLTRRKGRKAG
ncbi:MAG TPA: MBL fold metallo-hydrolase, partial [Longimicrobium sp.]|nr:MBL fold metallo-hydrolase [Longimicrobium sp.]